MIFANCDCCDFANCVPFLQHLNWYIFVTLTRCTVRVGRTFVYWSCKFCQWVENVRLWSRGPLWFLMGYPKHNVVVVCVNTDTELRQAFNRSTLDKYLLKCSVHSGHFRSTLTTASCLGHSCLWEHQRLHTTGWAPSPYFQGVLAQLPDLKPGVSLGSFLKASFELSRLS